MPGRSPVAAEWLSLAGMGSGQLRQPSNVVLYLLQMAFEQVNPGIDLLDLAGLGRRMLLCLLESHGECQINFVIGDANGLQGQFMFFRGTRRIGEAEGRFQRGFVHQLDLRRWGSPCRFAWGGEVPSAW